MISDVTFFWVALFAYLVGTIGYALNVALPKKRFDKAAYAILALGFAAQTIGLVLRTIASSHAPFTNMFEYASCLAWATVLFFLILQARLKVPNMGVFVAPIAFSVIVVASMFPTEIEKQLVPALQSHWLQIHVSLAVIAEGAFAVGFGASIMYLLKRRGAAWLPSLDLLDELTYRAVVIGYPLFTLGALFAGAIWAWKAWGTPWSWDPKEVGSLVVWLIYSAYLHSRFIAGWRGKKSAVLAIIGFSATIFTFAANLFIGGLHSYL